jgi:hypothetical protein
MRIYCLVLRIYKYPVAGQYKQAYLLNELMTKTLLFWIKFKHN